MRADWTWVDFEMEMWMDSEYMGETEQVKLTGWIWGEKKILKMVPGFLVWVNQENDVAALSWGKQGDEQVGVKVNSPVLISLDLRHLLDILMKTVSRSWLF